MLFQDQRLIDGWEIAGRQIVLARGNMGILAEQGAQMAGIPDI